MGAGITNGIIPSGGSVTFRGALVKLAAAATLTTGVPLKLPWAAEVYDTDAIHDNSTNNTRLTVPLGVTKVRLTGDIRWAASTVGSRYCVVKKNGNNEEGMGSQRVGGSDTQQDWSSIAGSVVEVIAGDYFELEVQQDRGGNLDVEQHEMTWFAMEIIL